MNHRTARNALKAQISWLPFHAFFIFFSSFLLIPNACFLRHLPTSHAFLAHAGSLTAVSRPFLNATSNATSPFPSLNYYLYPPISHQIASTRSRSAAVGMVAPLKNGSAYRGHGGGGGRPYGLMLLVALGAAILGVTVLHKLREGRLFSLLVKEKDHELLSLHLLLQREHEFSKEAQKKLQEMKANLYTIKAQKSEVEGRLLEEQSLVSSLRDEQKILESQLEEKRNEIKMLRQQQMTPNVEIREASIQKEGEIDDLKSHSEKPAGVWSVSSDDPSNPSINLQNEGMRLINEGTDRSKNETDTSKQEQRKLEGTSGEGQPLRNDTRLVDGKYEQSGSEQRMKTGSDGSDSGLRMRNGRQRKLRRKKLRDFIRRSGEEKNAHSEQKDALAATAKKSNQESENAESKDEHVTLRERQTAKPDQDSSLKADADSNAGKEEVDNFPEEDSREIDKDSDHVEVKEEAKTSKDDKLEHETN